MIPKQPFNLGMASQLARGAANLRKGLETGVARWLNMRARSPGAASGVSLAPVHVYRDRRSVARPLLEVADEFREFASTALAQWQKKAAETEVRDVGGQLLPVLVAQYAASFSPAVKLTPLTALARANEGVKSANDPRYDWCVVAIKYQYQCRFEFVETSAGQTTGSYETRETIDPQYQSRDRDLTRHYSAPPLPGGFGAVGEQFLQSLG